MARPRAWRAAAVALLFVGVAACVQSVVARPAVAAGQDPTRVTLLGDSTMAAMQWYQYDDDDVDTLANNDIREIVSERYSLNFSAESCRRLVVASCTGRFGTRPVSLLPYMQTTLAGRLGDALVVMAGYDDASITNAVDEVMAEAELQGVAAVLWLTYRTGTSYVLPGGQSARDLYQSHNAELQSAATRHPRLRLLDWNAYSAGQPASWFASDGIHLNPVGAVGLARYITAALDANPIVVRCSAASPHTGAVAEGATATVAPAAVRSGFVPTEPRRVLDTRAAAGANGSGNTGSGNVGSGNVGAGNVGAGRVVTLDLGDVLPGDATEAVLSVTAVDSCRAGYLTVFACGARPPTSTMNFEVSRTTAGMAITELTDRTACVFASSATDLVVDVIGAFSPSGQAFHPMTPTRWVDTRGGAAVKSELIGERSTSAETEVAVAGAGGVPANATAVWINLTIADPSGSTVLLASPGPCTAAPTASTVNANSSRNTASSALVGLGPNGSICVHTLTGRSQLVLDVAGWFGPGAGGLMFTPQAATRLIDTRTKSPTPSTDEVSTPLGAVSVLNAVAVEGTGPGYVSVRPCGSQQTSSLINTTANQDTANITAVAPGANGSVCVQASRPAHLVVDLVGAFIP